MIHFGEKKAQKNADYFVCKSCDFICSKKSDWDRHITRAKHLKQQEMIQNDTISDIKNANQYDCECGNKYKHHSGLWRHKKTCYFIKTPSPIDDKLNESTKVESKKDDLIDYLIKENQEFKNLILELAKKDNSVINNNTNTNCHNINNNTFNLNMFLNEKCKDAINIDDFVSNIKMQLSDLEDFGHMGYVEGVSRILIKNLKELDTYSRPIHCSDLKREVLYIKDNNEWMRETDDKPVLKNVIKQVANKNIKQIQTWKNEHPDCIHSESKKNDQYMNIVMNSMSGGTSEEQQNNISQIVKNVSKAVVIEKKAIQ
jgi:hypothetical protein